MNVFSKEYTVRALQNLITFVANEPQEPNLFSTNVVANVANGGRYNKEELLENLRLLEYCLPSWYTMPPALADTFKAQMGRLCMMPQLGTSLRSN